MVSLFELYWKILEALEIGKEIGLRGVNIGVLSVGSPLYAIIDMTDNTDEDKFLWVELEDAVIRNFLGEEKTDFLYKYLEKYNDGIVISENGYFFKNVNINGKVNEFEINTNDGLKKIRGITAKSIENNYILADWQRGAIYFGGEDESIVQMNDALKKRLSEALLSYVNTCTGDGPCCTGTGV